METDSELVWKALADPVRRSLLDMLRSGPLTTGTLSSAFDQTRFGVMKHLDVLESAGLVLVERRGRERWNFLNAALLKQSTDRWLTPFQTLWADRLTGLAHQLSQEDEMTDTIKPAGIDIQQEIKLPASRDKAFEALTRNINNWWGAGHRQAGDDSVLSLQPEIGAEMIETSANGHAVIWGRVEEVKSPERLYLSGRFAVKGAVAGRIHFDLESLGANSTLLKLSHQAVGPIPVEMQTSFARGWTELLGNRLCNHLAEAAR